MSIALSSSEDMAHWLCDEREPMQASISVAKLSALISKALEADGLTHDANDVTGILLKPLGDYSELLHQDDVIITVVAVYLHGADWMVSLAEHLGFSGEQDEFVDLAWMEGRPHIKAVQRALSMLAARAVSAVENAYEDQHGHSMMEVLLAATETGEGFDQSQARLCAQRRGLQLVN